MAPQFEFLLRIAAGVGEIMTMGGGPLGERRVVAIATAQRKARQVLLEAWRLL